MQRATKHRVEFPEGFDGYAREVEAKGWLPDVIVTINAQRYSVTFYDPARLAQDIEDELKASAAFFQCNLLVIPSVTRTRMEEAIASLARTGAYTGMTPKAD